MTSFSVYNKSSTNYMDPANWKWSGGFNRGAPRKPDINKLDKRELEATQNWNEREHMSKLLHDDGIVKYIKINHGSRKGSIARVDDFSQVKISTYMSAHSPDRITLTFDDGKTVKMKFVSLFNDLKDNECAELLLRYTGKTADIFTKNKREPEVPLDIFDAFGKQLFVEDWVLSPGFRIGKIKRISAKGTIWVTFIAHRGLTPLIEYRCSDPDTFAKLVVPDEFDSVSQIVDYNMDGMIADLAIDFKA